ncbi:MAG: AraC family transcriptional regulator [Blautia sp.]|uniref:AraC family transcriptional regulator n=1 Tax=Fusicatenibacter saccharivorans TaxID=1150298 RepID=UPI002ED590CF
MKNLCQESELPTEIFLWFLCRRTAEFFSNGECKNTDYHTADDPDRRFAEADGAVTDLRNTNEEIMSIALNYQFSSPGYFSKRFKGYTGLTPTEYRR